jgi:hypothetical protein
VPAAGWLVFDFGSVSQCDFPIAFSRVSFNAGVAHRRLFDAGGGVNSPIVIAVGGQHLLGCAGTGVHVLSGRKEEIKYSGSVSNIW